MAENNSKLTDVCELICKQAGIPDAEMSLVAYYHFLEENKNGCEHKRTAATSEELPTGQFEIIDRVLNTNAAAAYSCVDVYRRIQEQALVFDYKMYLLARFLEEQRKRAGLADTEYSATSLTTNPSTNVAGHTNTLEKAKRVPRKSRSSAKCSAAP